MTRPSGAFPEWATDENWTSGDDVGNPTKVEPTSGLFAQGFMRNDRPPVEYFNWLNGKQGEWLRYLYDVQRTLPLLNMKSSQQLGTDTVSTEIMAIVWHARSPGEAEAARWAAWYFGSTNDYKFCQDGFNWDESALSIGHQYYEAAITLATTPPTIAFAHGISGSAPVSTTTNGITHTDATIGFGTFEYIGVTAPDGNFVASSTSGSVQFSTDNGATFSAPSTGLTNWVPGAGFAAQLNYYNGRAFMVPAAGANKNEFVYTDDDGDNWTVVTVADRDWKGVAGGDVNGTPTWLAMNDENPPEIWVSTNNGASWSEVTSPTGFMTSGVIARKIFYHEGLFVCLEVNGRLWYTPDAGLTWRKGMSMLARRHDVSGVLFVQNWAQGGGGFAAICHQNGTPTFVTQTIQLGEL